MEAMITLLTPAFIPFFLILWIICKCIHDSHHSLQESTHTSVQLMSQSATTRFPSYQEYSSMDTRRPSTTFPEPSDVSFSTLRTKVSAPFSPYACDTILKGFPLTVGLNFGVQIAWIAVSCCTIIIFQYFKRRPEERRWRQENAALLEKRAQA